MKLSDGLRTVFLAGIGAVAVTGEKSKKIIDDLVKKGELTYEEGKILNEDLAKNLSEKVNEGSKKVAERAGKLNITRDNVRAQIRDAIVNIDKMTQDERDFLRAKLDAADKKASELAAQIKEDAEEVIDAIRKDATDDATAEAEQEDALEDAEKAVAEAVEGSDPEAEEAAAEIVEAIEKDAVCDDTVEAEQEDAIEAAIDAVAGTDE
ncbi:MAG: phasin family protein [Lachnospiraceae bacterium]|nr:phasin family protein [Lachnospiraceae bacterium]